MSPEVFAGSEKTCNVVIVEYAGVGVTTAAGVISAAVNPEVAAGAAAAAVVAASVVVASVVAAAVVVASVVTASVVAAAVVVSAAAAAVVVVDALLDPEQDTMEKHIANAMTPVSALFNQPIFICQIPPS